MLVSKKAVKVGFAIILMLSLFLSACSPRPEVTVKPTVDISPTVDVLKPVTLTYYIVGSEQKDLPAVNEAINKMTQTKINASIDIKLIDYGAYDQKMNLVISSGENYDLCFTSYWANGYNQKATKGSFLALDELIDKYAPKTKAGVPDKIWKVAKINGKTYGVINYQIMATAYGIGVQRELADKAGFDYKSVKKFEDVEPFLAFVKKNDPTKIPMIYSNVFDPFLSASPYFNLDSIGDQKAPGWVYINDESLKVVNQYETPEFKNLVQTMRKWYLAGYLRKDAATTKETTNDNKAAKYAAQFPLSLWGDTIQKDSNDAGIISTTGVRHYLKMLTNTFINTDRATATMTAISSTSKNPERAMMFIELLNSDKDLFNMFCLGIEGTHYKKVVGKTNPATGTPYDIELIPDSGYNPQTSWEFGNNANLLLSTTDAPTKDWVAANEQAAVSKIFGFSFDATTVTSEIAKCDAVVDEYMASLTSGSVDIDKYLAEFLAKLKVAGSDTIIAEKQKQITAWVTSNK